MKQIVANKRKLSFDELNSLVKEITVTSVTEYKALPIKERKRRKERFWDCLIDWYIDGFAAGLLFIGKDKDLPDFFRVLDITYPNGEKVSDLYEKNITNPESFLRMVEAESNRMWNTGLMDAGEGESGLYKTWETMMDDKVRDSHEFLEQVTIPYEEEFVTIGGDSALAPGMFSEAGNNVNCRCFLSLHNREVDTNAK